MPKVNSSFYKNLLAPKRNKEISSQGLIVHYELGSQQSYPGSGLVLYDISGKANNATFASELIYNPAPGYLDFEGTVQSVDYFTIPSTWHSGNFTTGMSFNIWLKSNVTRGVFKSNFGSLSINYQPNSSQFKITVTTTVLSGTAKNLRTNTFTFFTPVKWIMITGVYENSNKALKIYVDGVLSSTATNTLIPGTYFKSSAPTYIVVGRSNGNGAETDSWFYKGSLGSFRIYDQAITAEAIDLIYNEEKIKYSALGLS